MTLFNLFWPVTCITLRFSAQSVPVWMHGNFSLNSPVLPLLTRCHPDQAQDDLFNWTNDLVHVTTWNDWQHIALVQTYNPKDESEQNSIQTNATIVFVNGSLTIDDVIAIETVVYHVGVGVNCPLVLYISDGKRSEGVLWNYNTIDGCEVWIENGCLQPSQFSHE